MSSIIPRSDCNLCGKNHSPSDNVFTTWVPNSGFICRRCFEVSKEKESYEVIMLSEYTEMIKTRPLCYHCKKIIYTHSWVYCEYCNLDFCEKCNLISCNICYAPLSKEYVE